MDGLDLLGAEDALASQYITLRVKHIDRDMLKLKLGGSTGDIAKSAMSIVDMSPKMVLDVIKPLAMGKAKEYGIDLEMTLSNVPPSKGGRAFSEFWPGALAGTVFGTSLLFIGTVLRKIAGKI